MTITELNAAVIARVKSAAPGIPFTAEEKTEEIVRPAFKLILDEFRAERYAVGITKRTYPAMLVYFASDRIRPKIECQTMYETLEPSLLGYLDADALDTSISDADGVMIITFSPVDYADAPAPVDPGSDEPMETLDLQEGF